MANGLIFYLHTFSPVVCQQRYARCCFHWRLRIGAAERRPCVMKEPLIHFRTLWIHADVVNWILNSWVSPCTETSSCLALLSIPAVSETSSCLALLSIPAVSARILFRWTKPLHASALRLWLDPWFDAYSTSKSYSRAYCTLPAPSMSWRIHCIAWLSLAWLDLVTRYFTTVCSHAPRPFDIVSLYWLNWSGNTHIVCLLTYGEHLGRQAGNWCGAWPWWDIAAL